MSVLVQRAPSPLARSTRPRLPRPSARTASFAGLVLLAPAMVLLTLVVWQVAAAACLALATAAVLHRRRQVRAWHRELDAAFHVHDRRELNMNRVL